MFGFEHVTEMETPVRIAQNRMPRVRPDRGNGLDENELDETDTS